MLTIPCDESGLRLDSFLSGELEELSRSQLQRLLEDDCVTLGGQPVKKNRKTAAGDRYEIDLPQPQEIGIQPEPIPLDIPYEDGDVVVINKPKGLVVHPAAGHWSGTLVNALLYHCKDLSGINGALRPGIVHRIDMDTSGLLIVAKNDFSHQKLAAQLQDHTLCRTYEAIVCGGVREDCGVIDAPIGRSAADRKKMAVTEKNSRNAVTHWAVIDRYPAYTHLRLQLKTGRTHQIRVHLAWQNHPILGDTVYGHKKPELGQSSQCLHAKELTFLHPRTGLPVTVTSPLPDYFQTVLAKLGQADG